MARILFAREFGANDGHLAQLVPVALELRKHGHQPLFAVTDTTRAESALGVHGLEYLAGAAVAAQAAAARPGSLQLF